eukprot:g1210.t1
MASKGGLSLWPQRADRQAEVFVELPEGSAAVLRTSNVRRLQWRPSPQRQGVKQALVDGELLVVPEDEVASWCLQDDRWQLCGKLPLTERHARQDSPCRRPWTTVCWCLQRNVKLCWSWALQCQTPQPPPF